MPECQGIAHRQTNGAVCSLCGKRGKVTESMARVQGEGRRNGRTPSDIPDGYITWEEHYLAWENYSRRWSGRSAEQIEELGGFTYQELKGLLGRPPRTWRPRDEERHKNFELAEDDKPGYEDKVLEATASKDLPTRHIHYVGGINICEDDAIVPLGPVNFEDVEDGRGCNKCFARMVDWLSWFTGEKKS